MAVFVSGVHKALSNWGFVRRAYGTQLWISDVVVLFYSQENYGAGAVVQHVRPLPAALASHKDLCSGVQRYLDHEYGTLVCKVKKTHFHSHKNLLQKCFLAQTRVILAVIIFIVSSVVFLQNSQLRMCSVSVLFLAQKHHRFYPLQLLEFIQVWMYCKWQITKFQNNFSFIATLRVLCGLLFSDTMAHSLKTPQYQNVYVCDVYAVHEYLA